MEPWSVANAATAAARQQFILVTRLEGVPFPLWVHIPQIVPLWQVNSTLLLHVTFRLLGTEDDIRTALTGLDGALVASVLESAISPERIFDPSWKRVWLQEWDRYRQWMERVAAGTNITDGSRMTALLSHFSPTAAPSPGRRVTRRNFVPLEERLARLPADKVLDVTFMAADGTGASTTGAPGPRSRKLKSPTLPMVATTVEQYSRALTLLPGGLARYAGDLDYVQRLAVSRGKEVKVPNISTPTIGSPGPPLVPPVNPVPSLPTTVVPPPVFAPAGSPPTWMGVPPPPVAPLSRPASVVPSPPPAGGVIQFFGADRAWGEFSNMYQAPFTIQGRVWPTVEHWFQGQKFPGQGQEELIRVTSDPKKVKQMGKAKGAVIRPDWEDIKERIMWEGLVAKFTQHPELQQRLLGTGDLTLVERNIYDKYWGDGGNGSGRNRLGYLLMELRSQLRSGVTPFFPVAPAPTQTARPVPPPAWGTVGQTLAPAPGLIPVTSTNLPTLQPQALLPPAPSPARSPARVPPPPPPADGSPRPEPVAALYRRY